MLDIDHFRAVNTTYGHVTGDHVLRNVADILRHSARSEDIVARMGGEEFLIVMPNCAQDEGHHVADQMRRAIHGAKIAAKGADTPISVSVSIGLISAPSAEFPTLPDSLDEVIARADAALYLSKEAGRNQVSIM
jgi:diguanylate cyclase (GGDEF)-like protein